MLLALPAYAQVPPDLLKKAEEGDAEAQYTLGDMYYDGRYVPQDYVKATEWYRKAAEQKDAELQKSSASRNFSSTDVVDIQDMFCGGLYGPKYNNKTVEFYKKAAEKKNPYAQVMLGVLYEQGQGVPQNYYTAVKWFKKAAEQGNVFGQVAIGTLYLEGELVRKDYYKALVWYTKAIEQKDIDTQSEEDLSEYQRKGGYCNSRAEYTRNRKESQVAIAQRNLGDMYFEGKGVLQDYFKARELFEKASHIAISSNLAYMYLEGKGGPKDAQKAAKIYRSLAMGELSSKGNRPFEF